MNTFILIWIGVGTLVNLYYHSKNAERLAKQLLEGQFNFGRYIVSGFLTIIAWPIMIYLREVLKKDI